MKRCLVCMLLAICLLCGCSNHLSSSVPDSRYTIGVLLKAMNHQHWMDMRAGITASARNQNVRVVLLYPHDESAIDEQRAMFRDLVKADVDAILFAPCDSTACAPLVEEAQAAGISMMALDTRPEDVELHYVGANNILVGQLAADRLALTLGKRGSVAVIAGVEEQSAHRDRVQGFRERLETSYPEMELVEVAHANSDFELAMEKTDEIMADYPSLAGFFCTSAVMALGNIEQQFIGLYGTAPAVVAVDTQDDALNALQNGNLDALITQDGYEAGYQAIEKIVQLLDGQQIEEKTYISTRLLTRQTVEAFIQERQHGTGGELHAESDSGG